MPKFNRSLTLLASIALAGLLVGCSASKRKTAENMDSLAGLQAMTATNQAAKRNKGMSKIREMALREIALSLGAQAGLASRAKTIDEKLLKEARHLDTIYDFNALILDHNILPPVLLEGRNALNVANAQTIRVSDRTYKISKQARFVTTPPTWRQYLWMDYKKPEKPAPALLPRTKEERRVWSECIQQGWKNGIEQANTILEESIARIKEDFTGMVLYRKLLAMKMVSPPFVSHTDLGVTGNESEIHIDDKVLRITALPALNINSKEWIAAVSKDEEALKQLDLLESRATSAMSLAHQTWQPIVSPINE